MINEPALVCDLTAIPPGSREEHVGSAPELFRSARRIRELKDGIEAELPTDEATLMRAAQFIAHERLCCPFFTFTLMVKPANEAVLLRITGPEGVKELLLVELGENMGIRVG